MEYYYTTEQAANHFRVSKYTIREWVRLGKLHTERTDRNYFKFKSSEIHRRAEEVSLNKAVFYGTANGGNK